MTEAFMIYGAWNQDIEPKYLTAILRKHVPKVPK